jgi:hypothetical protein
MLRLLSLGWGTQSFTLAAMSALGELPPIHAALHADTTHERAATYQFAAKWTPWLESRGVRVVTLRDHAGRTHIADQAAIGVVYIPAFTMSPIGKAAIRRQCTPHWKVRPIRRWTMLEMRRLHIRRTAGAVEQWIGISLDEIQRIHPSGVKYVINRFPLVDLRMTRKDCEAWLTAHGLQIPVKSSCTFCPYHSREVWKRLQAEGGPDWAEAVSVDEAIRHSRERCDLFVHRDRVPLVEIGTLPDGVEQPGLFDQEECSGSCFL